MVLGAGGDCICGAAIRTLPSGPRHDRFALPSQQRQPFQTLRADRAVLLGHRQVEGSGRSFPDGNTLFRRPAASTRRTDRPRGRSGAFEKKSRRFRRHQPLHLDPLLHRPGLRRSLDALPCRNIGFAHPRHINPWGRLPPLGRDGGTGIRRRHPRPPAELPRRRRMRSRPVHARLP